MASCAQATAGSEGLTVPALSLSWPRRRDRDRCGFAPTSPKACLSLHKRQTDKPRNSISLFLFLFSARARVHAKGCEDATA